MSDVVNVIFELFINLFQNVVLVTFCYKFLNPSKSKRTNLIAYVSAICLMFLSITLINIFNNGFAYVELIAFFLIMIPYCLFFFEDKWYIKVIIPISVELINLVLGFGINYFFSAIIDCDYNYLMLTHSGYRYIYVTLVNVMVVICLVLIYNLFKNKLSIKSFKEVIISIIIPLVSVIIGVLLFYVSSNSLLSNVSRTILGCVSIIILLFSFINFYLITNISKNYELKKQNIISEKEKEKYQIEISNNKQYIHDVTEIKHNLKNQVACIKMLIEKQKYEEAECLCEKIGDSFKSANQNYDTGNVYFDALLNYINAKANSNNITLTLNCNNNLDFIDGEDLTILIGNLVDNAIEALKSEPVRTLRIDTAQKGHYVIINVQNNISKSVLDSNPTLLTSKNDKLNHGFGIETVRKIVEKYNGFIDFYEENNNFFVNMMFELPNIT